MLAKIKSIEQNKKEERKTFFLHFLKEKLHIIVNLK
jgi:hypothetical protein